MSPWPKPPSRRTPSARPAANSSSRPPGGPSGLGAWWSRPTAKPTSASRSTNGRPSKSRSRTRKSPCDSTSPLPSRAKPATTSACPSRAAKPIWQVRREPVYPRWWWWWGDGGGSRSQKIAGGRAKIDADGAFAVAFTPIADEKKDGGASSGLTYRYTLSVDVTDEGGETRSAERSFRLGFVSVEARAASETEFLTADSKPKFTVLRTDLNGTPKAGKGAYRVVRLVQPEKTLLPADQPLPVRPGTAEDRLYPPTPGDLLRARWETVDPATIVRMWKEGAEAAKGAVEHDAKGVASISLPALGAGAYRLLYETKDDFGAVCKDSLDFLVAGGAKPAFKLPLLLKAEKGVVPVGGKARILLDSGWSGQPVLFETFKGGTLWERRWLEAGKDSGIVEIPVGEDLRGGFGVRLTAVRDHQFMSEEALVFVPWDNKELGVSFATFRDKLTPGGRETWRVTVKTPAGKPAEKGAAELLAYMYDRSLDIFAPHRPPRRSRGSIPTAPARRRGTRSWARPRSCSPTATAGTTSPAMSRSARTSSSRSAATASAGQGGATRAGSSAACSEASSGPTRWSRPPRR